MAALKTLEMHRVLARYRAEEQKVFAENSRLARSTSEMTELRAQREALEFELNGGVTYFRRRSILKNIRKLRVGCAIRRKRIRSSNRKLTILNRGLEEAAMAIAQAPEILLIERRDLLTLERVILANEYSGRIFTTSLPKSSPVERTLRVRGVRFGRIN